MMSNALLDPRRINTVTLVAIWATCVSSGFVRASDYSDAVIADGAIHYWRFEELSTGDPAADEISGVPGQTNNPGTYDGGMTLGQPSAGPNLGNAARFDGADGTHVGLGSPQHPGDSISVEAWVNLDVNATASFSPVIARWDGSYELDVNATTGDALNFVVRDQTNTFGNATGAAVSRGVWHHVVGTYDGTTGMALSYIDGTPGTPVTVGVGLQDVGGDDGLWYIGRTRGPTSGFAWAGMIDELAIYAHVLTPEEIETHIALATVPEPSAVVLFSLGFLAISRNRRRGLRRRMN